MVNDVCSKAVHGRCFAEAALFKIDGTAVLFSGRVWHALFRMKTVLLCMPEGALLPSDHRYIRVPFE